MIRQFDVVHTPVGAGRAVRPFLVSIQHNFLQSSITRVLAPLVVTDSIKAMPRLNPALLVLGTQYLLVPDELVTLGVRQLGNAVANLEADREKIIAALDFVLTGI
jgi:toxin CcdB